MVNKIVLVTIITALNTLCFAQPKGYNYGYIVNLKGDTVRGYVKDRDPEPFVSLYNRIRFKKLDKLGKRKYGADDIRGYGYDSIDYQSVGFREESRLLKTRYILDPRVDKRFLRRVRSTEHLVHFEQEFIHDDNFYLDSYPLIYKKGEVELVRATQGILGLKKKRLSEYFNDCPELLRAIESERLKSVNDLFEFYHDNCLD